jgi:2-polyprenyl-3-methyl-5-hydroxy-6-metoxy-1,4-benzoquinol methylase
LKNYDGLHKLWARAHAVGSPTKFVRNEVVFRELDSLATGNTLDAGCGIGEYSIFLAEQGHKVTAFDPSPFAVRTLLEMGGAKLGIDVQINTIEGYHPSEKFDNIINIEVIEHIEFDEIAIKKLYSLLKNGGSLVISAPATPFLFSEADRISGHYRRYYFENFKKTLCDAGFEVLQIKRYGFPVLFAYTLLRKVFLDKILISHFASTSSGSKKKFRFFTKLYPFLFFVDRLNIPFLGVGYIAKCKK